MSHETWTHPSPRLMDGFDAARLGDEHADWESDNPASIDELRASYEADVRYWRSIRTAAEPLSSDWETARRNIDDLQRKLAALSWSE